MIWIRFFKDKRRPPVVLLEIGDKKRIVERLKESNQDHIDWGVHL